LLLALDRRIRINSAAMPPTRRPTMSLDPEQPHDTIEVPTRPDDGEPTLRSLSADELAAVGGGLAFPFIQT
jgi:hypothetical protein